METTTQAQIIESIKHHRVTQELTQKEVAARMGCNVSFVQALEYRKVDRRWSTIVKYATAVGVALKVEVVSE